MEEKISIQKESVLNAYKQATEDQKALLENMFGKDVFQPKNIMERVKTFEDACEVLGEEHPLVIQYKEIYDNFLYEGGDGVKDIVAYLKLRIICAALNDGWKPTFDGSRFRYYPWFYIYTKEEYEKLNKDEKKKCRVVGRSNSSAGAFASGASPVSHTVICSRLVFKTRELAEYCEKQFINIWADYLFA